MKIGRADVWAWGWHQQRIGGGERELPSEIRWYNGTRKAGLRGFHLEGYSNILQIKDRLTTALPDHLAFPLEIVPGHLQSHSFLMR
jgi:hypothetical protein